MNKVEIAELMRLKGWNKVRLAAELDLGENAIHKWLSEDRTPGGPASILMRLWLREARGEISIVEHEPPHANGHKKPGKNGHRKELVKQ